MASTTDEHSVPIDLDLVSDQSLSNRRCALGHEGGSAGFEVVFEAMVRAADDLVLEAELVDIGCGWEPSATSRPSATYRPTVVGAAVLDGVPLASWGPENPYLLSFRVAGHELTNLEIGDCSDLNEFRANGHRRYNSLKVFLAFSEKIFLRVSADSFLKTAVGASSSWCG